MTSYMSTVETAVGPFTVVVDDDGAVLTAGWTADHRTLLPLVHAGLRTEPVLRADVGPAQQAAVDYHRGDLDAPGRIPVRQISDGRFLTSAWATLRTLEPGEPVTYTELAARTGNPRAVRAAAQACARNAVALFVPCHRVLRADGSLGGFRWGVEVKRWLLTHEGRRENRAAPR
jgi:methylated-DNA-[protein]-cysteine S-methyltransferase